MKRFFVPFVFLAGCGLVIGCGSSAPQPAAPQSAAVPETLPEIPEGPVAECVGPDDEVVDCRTDSDCCEGFECGRDPDISSVRTVCVYSG